MATNPCYHVHLDGVVGSLSSHTRCQALWSRSNEGSDGTVLGGPSRVPIHLRSLTLRGKYFILTHTFDPRAHCTIKARFPERMKPGSFDIWGSSHQIFHILVLLAAATHLNGLLKAFDYNHTSPRC